MKKILAVVILMSIGFGMGCTSAGDAPSAQAGSDAPFAFTGLIELFTDPETKCEYWVIQRSAGIAIQPRMEKYSNAMGTEIQASQVCRK